MFLPGVYFLALLPLTYSHAIAEHSGTNDATVFLQTDLDIAQGSIIDADDDGGTKQADPVMTPGFFEKSVAQEVPETNVDLELAGTPLARAPLLKAAGAQFARTTPMEKPEQPRLVVDACIVSAVNLVRALKLEGNAFLFYGSALGIVRDGRSAPHDDDCDIAVHRDWYHPAKEFALQAAIDQQSANNLMDVWPYELVGDHVCLCWSLAANVAMPCYGGDAYPVDMILPTQDDYPVREIDALETAPMPRDPDAAVELYYGSGWRTPTSGADGADDMADSGTRASIRYQTHCGKRSGPAWAMNDNATLENREKQLYR